MLPSLLPSALRWCVWPCYRARTLAFATTRCPCPACAGAYTRRLSVQRDRQRMRCAGSVSEDACGRGVQTSQRSQRWGSPQRNAHSWCALRRACWRASVERCGSASRKRLRSATSTRRTWLQSRYERGRERLAIRVQLTPHEHVREQAGARVRRAERIERGNQRAPLLQRKRALCAQRTRRCRGLGSVTRLHWAHPSVTRRIR